MACVVVYSFPDNKWGAPWTRRNIKMAVLSGNVSNGRVLEEYLDARREMKRAQAVHMEV
jgi:hypothetical protein